MWPPKKASKKTARPFPKIDRSDGASAEGLGDDESFENQGDGGIDATTAPVSVSRGASSGGAGRAPKFLANSGMARGTAPINPKSPGGKRTFKKTHKLVHKQAPPTFNMKSFGGRI